MQKITKYAVEVPANPATRIAAKATPQNILSTSFVILGQFVRPTVTAPIENMDALATVGRDTPPSQSFITGIPTDVATSDRVVLNVGGTRFETCVSTLTAHPDTLLGAMFAARSRGLTKPDSKGEYFFDR